MRRPTQPSRKAQLRSSALNASPIDTLGAD
jgi:hypothetical protein